MTFAEMSLLSSIKHNRSLKRIEKISQIIDWHASAGDPGCLYYTIGTSPEGADADSPIKWMYARTRSKGQINHKWDPQTVILKDEIVAIGQKLIVILHKVFRPAPFFKKPAGTGVEN